MCYEDCLSCTVKVKKTLPCGHVKNDIPCGFDCDEVQCNLPCIRSLKCAHRCLSKCYEPCKPCENLVSYLNPFVYLLSLFFIMFR